MASTYLTRTPGSSGQTSRYKGTISVWVKRSNAGEEDFIFYGYESSSNRMKITFLANGKLQINSIQAGSNHLLYETTRVFKDISAWYHIVIGIDTTLATAGDRCRLYVNGVEETSFSTETHFSQNDLHFLTENSVPIYIGSQASGNYFDGLMTHYHLIDGIQYDASAFGQTDATTGIWKPKTAPSVTYGTHGFFLKFENSGSMGTDSSGNSNNLTISGTMIQAQDTPNNNFATGNKLIGRHSNGNYLQPDWSNANLTATADGSAWRIFKSSLAASSGKYYAEFKWVSDSNTRYAYVGIYDEDDYAAKTSGYPYASDMANGHAYYSENGNYYTNNTNTSFGSAFSSTGDGIVGVAMDLDNSKVYWSSNGSWQGGGDPSNGTGGKSITANKLYSFGLSLYSVGSIVYSANFGNGYFGTTAVSSAVTNASGNGIFEYDVPTGFTALSTKGLNL